MMVDKCTAVHCGDDTDRTGGVTVYECNFDGNVDIVKRDVYECNFDGNVDIVKRDIGEVDDVCNDLNVEQIA